MTQKSKIEWTQLTWNPVTGCSKISEGCKNCYAERMSRRLQLMGQKKYINGFELTLHPDTLNYPSKLKKPSIIFVNSMSDLFHENVPFDFVKQVFDVMNKEKQHIFQVVTKRADIMLDIVSKLEIGDNIWLGVTIENNKHLDRLEYLKKTKARIKFLSLEPLLSDLFDLDPKGVNWVIVGGESGPGSREIKEEWVTDIRDKCIKNKIPFFFKQWGGINKKKSGKLLEGKVYNEFPI
ncbi:MAG: phage Gp37/Gp68 family protein [Candidatus Gracilibacteria bacterium]|nr:phage Gp37/Gp68 family protein [Candidatus Gracilibacteria bacterium]